MGEDNHIYETKKMILVGMFTVSFLWQAYEYINAPTMEDDEELYLKDDPINKLAIGRYKLK